MLKSYIGDGLHRV